MKHEECAHHQTPERDCMIPVQLIAEVVHRENAKHGQRDHFLDHLQLIRCVDLRPHPVSRNLKAVFERSDKPAHQDHFPQRYFLELEVTVPRKGHKHVRSNQQHHRQYTCTHPFPPENP